MKNNIFVAFVIVCLFAATAAAQQPAAQQPAQQQTVAQQPAQQQTVQQDDQQQDQPSAEYKTPFKGIDTYINSLPTGWQAVARFVWTFIAAFGVFCATKIAATISDQLIPFSGLLIWLIGLGFIISLTLTPQPISAIAGAIAGYSVYNYILTLMPVDEITG